MSKQSRCFCFTLNNWISAECPELLLADITYARWGEEEAPDTGTPHLQGVIYFKKKVTIKGILKKNYFDGLSPHFELCRGTLEQNLSYVSKGGITHEFGVLPASPGEIGGRVEVDRWTAIRALVTAPTYDVAAIADAYPMETLLHLQKMDALRHRLRPRAVDRPVLTNYWIVGPTGTGKSQKARSYGSYYCYDLEDKWFTHEFDYQDVLIIDELTPGALTFSKMSKWTDHYPFVPPYKCGHYAAYRPAIIVVTSNYTIRECFPRDFAPLERRFTVVNMTESIKTGPTGPSLQKLTPGDPTLERAPIGASEGHLLTWADVCP
nr:MAG: replication associated protein [Cressdnaviricota sp.]